MEIRNFVIIAHVDHGKSTLADRMLELTGTIEQRKMREQYLDTMELERERGITIKLQPVRMHWRGTLINLIDTPGHSDFSYEVSRSIAAVEGAVLLVDASQGVQAQTLAVLEIARKQGLRIIPVVNKIDLSNASPEETAIELKNILHCQDEEILFASGKTGEGVKEILDDIIERIPPWQGSLDKPKRALVFDAVYDSYRGVILYVKVIDGCFQKEERLELVHSSRNFLALEVGGFFPERKPLGRLCSGEIGYIVTDLKALSQARVGDTVRLLSSLAEALPGYSEPQPLLFADFYPASNDEADKLKNALAKLKLSDASLVYEPIHFQGLGSGFRIGFLGRLHLEIVKERLLREEGIETICTSPLVPLKIIYKDGHSEVIREADSYPSPSEIARVEEPYVLVEVVAPLEFLGRVFELFSSTECQFLGTEEVGSNRRLCRFATPLLFVISELNERLKSATQGYATLTYRLLDSRNAELAKLEVIIAGEKIPFLSRIVRLKEAEKESRALASHLKAVLPRQLFEVVIQVACNGRILARETLPPLRKDVIAKLYGGDVSRKKKLLEKQKEGKKRLKALGKLSVGPEVFSKLLKTNSDF